MCGLTGIFNTDGSPVDTATVKRMMNVQRHRGPDDQGIHLGNLASGVNEVVDLNKPIKHQDCFNFGVAFNRLSIIDLSVRGHQPMQSTDGKTLIAYNGEVYNAASHRPELESIGYVFRGHSDTEVILNLYREHGIKGVLERLNGMFAFCLVDFSRQEIFLARDRLGIKPLYVWRRAGTFLFSSEVKSFLQHPLFRAEIDHEGLDEFTMFRYRAGDKTLLKDVNQIPPGNFMRLSPGKIKIEQYWHLKERGSYGPSGMVSAATGLQSHLKRSIDLRLISDVTLGCQLSGGLDSSLLTVLSARERASKLDAISITFGDAKYSEEQWIDQVRNVEPITIHKFKLGGNYFSDNFERATWHLDQPINHPNSIGILKIAEVAKPLVTVLLSGEGADELFAGYPRFRTAALMNFINPILPIMTNLLTRKKGRISTFLSEYGNDLSALVATGSAVLWPSICRELRPEFRLNEAIASRQNIFANTKGDFLGRCVDYELQTYLQDILVRQDKMTMAHSIEARVPYLDHELVEYARTIPTKYLARAGTFGVAEKGTKRVLKKTGLKYFDRNFVYRKKSGFPLPLREFFNNRQFVERIEDQLLPGIRERGLMDFSAVNRAWCNRNTNIPFSIEVIWIAATFEMWAQKFLGERPQVS